jgi:hypothetical protein
LVGRVAELAEVDALLERSTTGRGQAATWVGPAGTGKTVLLDEVAARARARGAQVVRATGAEGSGAPPWAVVAELALGFEEAIRASTGPRAEALRRALALEEGGGELDPLAVALGLLDLLAGAAAGAPVVVVVDDLHGVDEASRRALALVARRLGDDPVAIVAGSRPGTAALGAEHVLAPLADRAARELLDVLGVRARPVQDRLIELADGSPLVLRRLVRGLTVSQRQGSRPLPVNLRLPAELRDLYAGPLAELDAPARLAVGVVAADTSRRTPVVERALAQLGSSLEALEGAEEAGLVELAGTRIDLSHPLVRSAAYQAMSAPARRRAHAALASAEGDETPAGVLHRAAAAVGPDADLDRALVALGDEAMVRGAPLAAASRFVLAADLAVEAVERADRLVRAARAAVAAGEARWGVELLDEARAADAVRADALDAEAIEVRGAVAAGRFDRARAVAEAADAAHVADDPLGVADLLVEAARPILVEDPAAAAQLTERAWALVQRAGGRSLRAEVLLGCVRFVHGDPSATAHLDRWPELLDAEGPVGAGAFLAETVVLYLGYSGRPAAALDLLDRIEAPIRASCASGALVGVLAARSFVAYGIDLRECVAAGREALQLSDETGQPGLSAVALDTLSIAAATVGDDVLTHEVCERLLASGTEQGEVWARASLARLHLVRGRPEAAVEQFAALRRRIGATNRSFTQFEADEAEALVRAGRLDDARAVLPALAADAAQRGAWSEGQHERILALLAPDIDTASVHFAAASEAFARTDNKIAQGIAALTWGEWLRRAKRRAEARRQLQRAVEVFGIVGATGMRQRAEEELVAAGGTTDRTRPVAELLGDIELQVARLAAAGETNRSIATALFLSPRTIENHLGAVYRKLGVAGRPGLVARAAADPELRGPARVGRA